MRRLFGVLLLPVALAALAGCGDDDGTAQGPRSTQEQDPELVQMIALTSAGGKVSPEAWFVDDREQMQAYVKQFDDRDQVTGALQQAAKDAGERDGRLAVATVAIGCDVPPGVTITEGDDGPEIHPAKIVEPHKECFAATTSIALVSIP